MALAADDAGIPADRHVLAGPVAVVAANAGDALRDAALREKATPGEGRAFVMEGKVEEILSVTSVITKLRIYNL